MDARPTGYFPISERPDPAGAYRCCRIRRGALLCRLVVRQVGVLDDPGADGEQHRLLLLHRERRSEQEPDQRNVAEDRDLADDLLVTRLRQTPDDQGLAGLQVHHGPGGPVGDDRHLGRARGGGDDRRGADALRPLDPDVERQRVGAHQARGDPQRSAHLLVRGRGGEHAVRVQRLELQERNLGQGLDARHAPGPDHRVGLRVDLHVLPALDRLENRIEGHTVLHRAELQERLDPLRRIAQEGDARERSVGVFGIQRRAR